MHLQTPSLTSERTPTWAGCGQAAPWILLAALLVVSGPLFVAMPLTSDTVLYDLQARTVLNGGVLYRDVLEPNLPGIVWLHLLIRSIVGWSSAAIRLVDLLIVGTVIWLLSGIATRTLRSPRTADEKTVGDQAVTTRGWLVLLMAVFYLSRNEWCHCQRDTWMLLPSVLALQLRITRLDKRRQLLTGSLNCVVEGILWGAAFWMKPHIAIPAACVIGVDLWLTTDRTREFRRTLCVVAGGIVAAVPGILWLVQTGAWTHFLDMQLNWNPEYLQAGADRRSWARVGVLLERFHPWWLVHVAGAVALIAVFRQLRGLSWNVTGNSCSDHVAASLGVFAFSWLTQASLLQHAMDYIQVPPVLLMLGFLGLLSQQVPVLPVRCAVATMLALGLIASPQLNVGRLQQWPAAVSMRPSWQQKNVLACGRFPNWNDLGHVVEFLKSEQVRTGDVTCYSVHSIHVYAALGLQPSTRYVGIAVLPELFPGHRGAIESAVAGCGSRFVVSDDAETTPHSDRFPWNLQVAFQSGTLKVYTSQQKLRQRTVSPGR